MWSSGEGNRCVWCNNEGDKCVCGVVVKAIGVYVV